MLFRSAPLMRETHKLFLRLIFPDGWSAGYYPKTFSMLYPQVIHKLYGDVSVEFDVTAGESVDAVNRIYAEITSTDLCYPALIPIVLVG